MSRAWSVVGAVALVGVLGACSEQSPTSLDPDGIPFAVRTFEVEIPWSDFGRSVQSFSGFGVPADVGLVVLANAFEGVLDARGLVRFDTFPTFVTVRNAEGSLVADTAITLLGGSIIADVIVPPADSVGSWEFAAGALSQEWSVRSATWEAAVDTIGELVPWTEPGAGPVRPIGVGTLELSDTTDSVLVTLDSLTLAEWRDPESDRSMRFDLLTPDRRVRATNFRIRLDIGSTIDADTTVVREVALRQRTFIYSPAPEAPDGTLRVGGAPAWRTVFGLDIPTVLDGPQELCDLVGCPYALTPSAVNRASLVLRTRGSPPGFEPQDTLVVDTRPVLAPDALPKSPLGDSFVGGSFIGSEAFREGAEEPVEIQITSFVRAQVDPDADGSEPSTIALLSAFEPIDVALAEFDGPDDEGAPRLRLFVTVSERVTFR